MRALLRSAQSEGSAPAAGFFLFLIVGQEYGQESRARVPLQSGALHDPGKGGNDYRNCTSEWPTHNNGKLLRRSL